MIPFRFLPKVLRVLLIVNAVVFGIAAIVGGMLGLHLNLPGVGYGSLQEYILYFGSFLPTSPFEVWRYVTYMFIHVDFMHFFFNMLMLWMFGAEVAQWMGAKHFTVMYFFCGIFAAFFSVAMCILGLTNNPIIGASGALMGVFVAYYKFFPERRILMFFIIPMKIKHAMWVMIAFDVMFANTGDAIAHFAHLGGVVAGFIYMALYQNVFTKSSILYNSPLSGIFRLFSSHPEKYKKWDNPFDKKSQDNEDATNRDSEKEVRVEEPEVLEGEVFYMDEQKRMDEILRKVSREGINSLTDSERQFLLQAGDRIRRRRGGM
jgi:membrane associated rhomboid family serine protease